MSRAAALLGLAAALGCSETRDRFLPVPLPLAYHDGVLRGLGSAVGGSDVSCDDEAQPAAATPVLIDAGTPLSAFLGAADQPSLRHDRGRVFLGGEVGGAAGPTRLLLCDVPILQTSQPADRFRVQWAGASLPAAVVLGGDLLARFSLLWSFGAEPDQPLCLAPPCLRIGRSDLASNCRLASRGEAVFPFTLLGGDLLVQFGDGLVALPPTRVTVAACAEPAADPLAGATPAPCLLCEKLKARQQELGADMAKNRCRLSQLEQLSALICDQRQPHTCDARSALPGPSPAPLGCPDPPAFEDLIVAEGLFDPRYQPSGTNLRLLVSTALPGLLLSRSAYARLKGEAAAAALFAAPGVPLQMPGFAPEVAHPTIIGGAGAPALALVSRELQLSPCEELARSRRQRYGLPRADDPDCRQTTCARSACLMNLTRDSAQTQRRCGYGGQNPERACDDLQSPVAAALELDGPISEVLVADDIARVLESVNDELRSGSAQIDGILGVAVLARMQAELDYAGGRLAAHCRCGGGGCRAYRRFTYKAIDDCAEDDTLCLPATTGAAPGAVAPVACR